MNNTERAVVALLATLGVIIILWTAFEIGRTNSEKKRCESSNGTYSREICFKNELLIRVK